MSLFSHRKGLKQVKNVLQVDSVDSGLRSSLWNMLDLFYWRRVKETFPTSASEELYPLSFALWDEYFKRPVDTLGRFWYEVVKELRSYFFGCEWYEVYDFVEFVANRFPGESTNQRFMGSCNHILERELSAYRFVGGKITEISSEEEINEVEEALQSSSPFKSVTNHLSRSLALLADKSSPDYRNSIKESVCAVEAACNIVTGSSNATLGQALKEIEKKNAVDVHPALKGAFEKLYGYTSDADGIRHALLKESNLDFEDAKFMLVSSSAFINYLKAKSAKAGIEL